MSDWLPSYNALRAFEATARHLSFLRAAGELHVSPSAVKQLVRRLEDSLGTTLIERNGRGLRLTDAGAAGLRDLVDGFDRITQGVGRIRAHDGRKRLVITVEPSFASAWLVPRLDRFRAVCPDVDVLVDSSPALVDLDRSAADVAIRFGGGHDGLVSYRLFDEALCAFASPRLGLSSIDDLACAQLIHWDIGALDWATQTRAWMGWAPWLRKVGRVDIDSTTGIRFRDYNLALQAAVAGQGVILGSLPVLVDFLANGLLVVPFAEKVETNVGYDVLATPAALERMEVRAFIDWIRAAT